MTFTLLLYIYNNILDLIEFEFGLLYMLTFIKVD